MTTEQNSSQLLSPNEIHARVTEGHIHSRMVFEMAGKPKEHVEKTIREYVDRIKQSSSFSVLEESYAEAIEQEGMWSSFVEIELLVKGLSNYIGLCFDFMPSSVEILAPDQMSFGRTTVSNLLNDMQGKLHAMDMVAKNSVAENNFLKQNFNRIVRNLVSIVLYKKELTIEEVSSVSGIPTAELESMLEDLIRQNKIARIDDRYTLVLDGVKSDGQESS